MWPRLTNVLAAHYWTVAPALRHMLWPLTLPPWRDWETHFVEHGTHVRVTGRLHEQHAADTLVIVLHGLGGNTRSHYCARAARAACARGWSCLRLALRGADGGTADLYHAGLTSDLRAALCSDQVARHRRVFVIGYSLGGHVALRAACTADFPRMSAVATICAPLDLALGADAFDTRAAALYRFNILRGLKRAYAAAERRASLPSPFEHVRRARKIREWDALTVVPRFGFAGVDDYYRRASVSGCLARLDRPALLIYSRHDPIVPVSTVLPALNDLPGLAQLEWIESSGHAGFPRRVRISGSPARSLDDHVLDWLSHRATCVT